MPRDPRRGIYFWNQNRWSEIPFGSSILHHHQQHQMHPFEFQEAANQFDEIDGRKFVSRWIVDASQWGARIQISFEMHCQLFGI